MPNRAIVEGHAKKVRSAHKTWLPKELIAFSVAGCLLALISLNPIQTLFGVILVPIIFTFLWRPGEMPVLLFVAGYQWVQVMMPIISANFAGIPLREHPQIPNLWYGSNLALMAILFLAIGMRLGRGYLKPELVNDARLEIAMLNERKLLLAYAVSHIVAEVAKWLASNNSGLSQPLSVFTGISWVVAFIIIFAGVIDRKFRRLAAVVFIIELLLGFLGFFSGFKQILFVTIVAIMAANKSSKSLLRPGLITAVLALLALMTLWQTVKEDYRDFLNQGTSTQSVLVPVPERLSFLVNSMLDVTGENIVRGFETGIDRAGYLEYLSRSTVIIPDYIDYQNGRLLWEAVQHPFTPRILFPQKPAIDDSARVNEFTGMRVAGAAQGTSISLGYVAESYVDFGPLFMMIPIFAIGTMWGLYFRWLSGASPSRLLSIGFATSLILSNAIYFESSNMKLIGGGLSFFIGAYLILKTVDRKFWSMIAEKKIDMSASFGRSSRSRKLL